MFISEANMKKIFCGIVVLLLAAFSAYAQNYKTEGDFLYREKNGEISIFKYRGESTDVVIPDKINGLPVTSVGQYAFENMLLTSVKFPDSVKTIEKNAFAKNNLQNLIIPNTITSIGNYAFHSSNIKTLVIGTGITEIGKGVFSDNMLTKLVIPDNIIVIKDYAFENNLLTSLTLGKSVTSILGSAFKGNKLVSVVFPESVTLIESEAFRENLITGSINVPKNAKVSSIAFDDEVKRVKK